MTTIDPTAPLPVKPKQQLNSNSTKPLRGFNTHPENINRKGAPKREWTFKSEIEKALEQSTKNGVSYKELLIKSLLREGIKGNVNAIEKIMDRLDGKPLQKQEIEAKGDWNIIMSRGEK
jgi:hypothetical protein